MSRWGRWFGSDSNGYQELESSSQSSQRATTVPNKTKQVQVKEISAEELENVEKTVETPITETAVVEPAKNTEVKDEANAEQPIVEEKKPAKKSKKKTTTKSKV